MFRPIGLTVAGVVMTATPERYAHPVNVYSHARMVSITVVETALTFKQTELIAMTVKSPASRVKSVHPVPVR